MDRKKVEQCGKEGSLVSGRRLTAVSSLQALVAPSYGHLRRDKPENQMLVIFGEISSVSALATARCFRDFPPQSIHLNLFHSPGKFVMSSLYVINFAASLLSFLILL